jgi:hypothetical protein
LGGCETAAAHQLLKSNDFAKVLTIEHFLFLSHYPTQNRFAILPKML